MKKYTILLTLIFSLNIGFSQDLHLKIKEENPLTKQILQAKFFDNKSFVFSGLDSNIYVVDLNSLKISKTISGLFGKADFIAFSSDKKMMAATSFDNELTCWDSKNGKKHTISKYEPGYVQGHNIVFLPGDTLFSSTGQCDFPVYKSSNAISVDTLKSLEDECFYGLGFSSDGKSYYAGGNGNVWKYDLEKKKVSEIKKIDKISVVTDLAWSDKSKVLAVAGRSGLLILDENLKQKFQLKGHKDWINDICFSRDEKFLYSCSGTLFGTDRSIRIWNVENGNCEKVMTGHTDDVNSIDVSPDGKFIVSASSDQSIKLWSTKDQKLVLTIVPIKKGNKVSLLFYTPEGDFFGSAEIMDYAELFKGEEVCKDKITFSKKNKKIIKQKLEVYN